MTKKFNPDWNLLEVTQESLREHMAIAKSLQERVAELESILEKKAVIGQWMIDNDGQAEGTVISTGEWPKIISDAGLRNQWLEIAFRPIKTQ